VGKLEQQDSKTNRRLSSLENKVDVIDGRLQALENDVRDIYYACRPTKRDDNR